MKRSFKWMTEVYDYATQTEFENHITIMRNKGFGVKESYGNPHLERTSNGKLSYTAIFEKHY